MIFKRRWPSAVAPFAHRPAPSGPRGAMLSIMAEMAPVEAAAPVKFISPQSPHMR